MNTTDVNNIIQPFLSSIDNNSVTTAYMYAFKTKNVRNSANPYISLNYEFFDVRMPKDQVINAFKNILDFFKTNILSKDTTIFEEYSINNAKKIIDFIKIPKLDFSNNDISSGNIRDLDSDNYKIQYFINQLNTNCQKSISTNDYKKYKHSIIELKANNESIFIVNKVSPIYKPKGFLFTFDTDDDSVDYNFKPLEKNIFKLPFHPHIIIAKELCLLIEDDVESIFGFEKYNKKIRDEKVTKLNSELSLDEDSFKLINTYCTSGKNYNLFSNFNETRYKNIKDKVPETLEMLKNKIGLTVNTNQEIVISNENQAEKFILYLCDSLLQDIHEESKILYEAKKTKPLIN